MCEVLCLQRTKPKPERAAMRSYHRKQSGTVCVFGDTWMGRNQCLCSATLPQPSQELSERGLSRTHRAGHLWSLQNLRDSAIEAGFVKLRKERLRVNSRLAASPVQVRMKQGTSKPFGCALAKQNTCVRLNINPGERNIFFFFCIHRCETGSRRCLKLK